MDQGEGMPEHVKDYMFEPFFTTKKDRGGTGMGRADCLVRRERVRRPLLVQSRDVAGEPRPVGLGLSHVEAGRCGGAHR